MGSFLLLRYSTGCQAGLPYSTGEKISSRSRDGYISYFGNMTRKDYAEDMYLHRQGHFSFFSKGYNSISWNRNHPVSPFMLSNYILIHITKSVFAVATTWNEVQVEVSLRVTQDPHRGLFCETPSLIRWQPLFTWACTPFPLRRESIETHPPPWDQASIVINWPARSVRPTATVAFK